MPRFTVRPNIRKVAQLADAASYVLKSTYDAFVASTNTAINGKEPSLGNPDTDGKVLTSTDEGVRSWGYPTRVSNGGAVVQAENDGEIALNTINAANAKVNVNGNLVMYNAHDFVAAYGHIVLANNAFLRGTLSSGTSSFPLIGLNAGNQLAFDTSGALGTLFGGNVQIGGTLAEGAQSPAQHVAINSRADKPVQILQGAASQTAPLQKSQLISSTGTVRDAGARTYVWTDPTDATRTSEERGELTRNGVTVEAYRYDNGDTADQTNFWLLHDGTLTRVEVGAADSGGTGKRMLVIPN